DRNVTGVQTCALPIWDLGVATIEAQSSGQGVAAAEQARDQLVSAWRDYVERYGPINRYQEVWRTPSDRHQQQLVNAAEVEWRATLPEHGEVWRYDAVDPE